MSLLSIAALVALWAVGYFGWRLFPRYPRGTLLLAHYDTPKDEFIVRYQYRSVLGMHRCAFVSNLDGSPSRVWPAGKSLTLTSALIRTPGLEGEAVR